MKWTECGFDPITGCKIYRSGMLTVLTAVPGSVEYKATGLYHLSISHPMRYPTWDEIKEARYDLLPDEITMAMLLPPSAKYVNIHKNCFHLHQVDGSNVIR